RPASGEVRPTSRPKQSSPVSLPASSQRRATIEAAARASITSTSSRSNPAAAAKAEAETPRIEAAAKMARATTTGPEASEAVTARRLSLVRHALSRQAERQLVVRPAGKLVDRGLLRFGGAEVELLQEWTARRTAGSHRSSNRPM